ncbi:MAG: NAD-dependent epimerase/dehydratase family protein [Chloroflexota bacterium]|nr:NAD-dependent epimerase/dehydratase family protein [Chloroflexota bacterium]MDE2909624.1 NAD-dependent epimerase/dehydratase family protein [Chloroflexota bacterium]
MRVFIAGIDGYLGWPLAIYLNARGHTVAGADLLLRREWVAEVGGISALPIAGREERLAAFKDKAGAELDFRVGDLTDYQFVKGCIQDFQPEAVVHLGQMPSAPYSMMDQAHCVWTQQNNVINNLNILWAMKEAASAAHLIKLGTMGEYGTPAVDIPEGFFEVEFRGRKDRLPFPRQAGSWYHQSKVHDSHNTDFASKIWGIRATDIMQGVVFGTRIPEMGDDMRMRTRLDFDQCFGTAINRFCCQAVIGHPLTLYGLGMQRRGFLPLADSMQCLALAVENPPEAGEYRVFNQFENAYSISELAQLVKCVAADIGLSVEINRYVNPRTELEDHYYKPDRQHLLDLGYQPTRDIQSVVRETLLELLDNKGRIEGHADVLIPDIRWDGVHRRSEVIR